MEHFVEGNSAAFGCVEILEEGSHFLLADINSESFHAELELRWVEEAIALLINSSEEDSESSQSISWLLLFASLNNSGGNIFETGNSDFILVI